MSEKQPAFRYLTQGGKGARQADGSESLGLPVPTLEERARFFLRAVHTATRKGLALIGPSTVAC
jgi:hypothetical protein